MDYVNGGPCQLLKKDPTLKIKAKSLKQLKALKYRDLIDNKLNYLKPDSPTRTVSYSGSWLYYLNKYIANILKTYVIDKSSNAKNSTTFSNHTINVPIEDDEVVVSFDVLVHKHSYNSYLKHKN